MRYAFLVLSFNTNTMEKHKPCNVNLIEPISNILIKNLTEDAQESGYTYLHCVYAAKQKYINGGWINIWPTTYLSGSGKFLDDLEMIQAVNIPVAPNKFHFAERGQVKRFTLIFPAIPKDWKEFCLVEMVDDRNIGFKSRKIRRNETGIYNVFVEWGGPWFKRETNKREINNLLIKSYIWFNKYKVKKYSNSYCYGMIS